MFSDIVIWPLADTSGTVQARGKVTVADVINVNFTVMNGKNGLFVSLPSHKGKDKEGADKWYNDVFIEDKGVFADLNKQVLAALKVKVGTAENQPDAPTSNSQGGTNDIPW